MTGKSHNQKQETIRAYETRLLRVLNYIDCHLAKDLSLDELAGVAHFSVFHFHRIFKGMTGEPVAAYIRRRRLEYAADQLLLSNSSITDLAYDAKFENAESFSRAFKSRFGVSPSHYKRSGKVVMTVPALKSAQAGRLLHQAQALATYMETEGRKFMFEVQLKTFEKVRLAALPHRGPYDQIGHAFEKMCSAAGQQQLFGPNPKMLALYFDDPHSTAPEELRSEACLEVTDDASIQSPLVERNVDTDEYAVVMLKGPYTGLQAAYDWLFGHWLPSSGKEAANKPSLELYLNDPSSTKPEDLLTEIRIPLA